MLIYLSVPLDQAAEALALGAVRDPSGRLFVPQGLPLAQFQPWLPQSREQDLHTLAMPSQAGMSLSGLLARCGAAVKNAFPQQVWVRIEVAQIKSSSGHLYIGAIERNDEGMELARCNATIWSSSVTKLGRKFKEGTGMELGAGIQVLVLVKPVLEARYGLSLQIVDIDPTYTLGDLKAKLKRIRDALEASGDAGKNRALACPSDFHHVAVISPAGAAGLEDFQAEANRLVQARLCQFTYFEAFFQGERTKESIKQAFVAAHTAHDSTPFCALAIIRGGGAAADLHWLDEHLIAAMVCRFRVPVFTGVGHERDKPLIDEYAHRAFGTPSKVIAFIMQTIAHQAQRAHENWSLITQGAAYRLEAAQSRCDFRLKETLGAVQSRMVDADHYVERQMAFVKSEAQAKLADAASKATLQRNLITSQAESLLRLAEHNARHASDNIGELAIAKLGHMASKVQAQHDAIAASAQGRIEGVSERSHANWQSISDAAHSQLFRAEEQTSRQMQEVRFSAGKQLDEAQSSARELMSGIMAHGVAPTLSRGFAVVRSNDSPVSTRQQAMESDTLEIEFRDGRMKVKKEDA